LWLRVWAHGHRFASKDCYTSILRGGSDMNFGECPFHTLR
jgi:hypothetical protein